MVAGALNKEYDWKSLLSDSNCVEGNHLVLGAGNPKQYGNFLSKIQKGTRKCKSFLGHLSLSRAQSKGILPTSLSSLDLLSFFGVLGDGVC